MKASLLKRRRESERRLDHEERNRKMKTIHEDKALGPDQTKLSPAAQAALARNTADLALSPEEAHEVGLRTALAAEDGRRNRDPWTKPLRDAAEPTPDESAELARATAIWQKYHDATEIARTVAREDDEWAWVVLRQGYENERAEPAHQAQLAAARAKARASSFAFDRAWEDEQNADRAVTAARGAIYSNGAARQRAFLWRSQR